MCWLPSHWPPIVAPLVTRWPMTENNIRSCGEIDMDGPELPNIRAALAKFGGAA